jgi:hypothetical protein
VTAWPLATRSQIVRLLALFSHGDLLFHDGPHFTGLRCRTLFPYQEASATDAAQLAHALVRANPGCLRFVTFPAHVIPNPVEDESGTTQFTGTLQIP